MSKLYTILCKSALLVVALLLSATSMQVAAQESVVYTVNTVSAVTCDKTPDPFTTSYEQTYKNTKGQLTANNSATLTVSNFTGYKLEKVVLSMHTNASKGAGNISVTTDDTEVYNEAYGAGNGTAWRDVEITPSGDWTGDEIKIVIAATVNSLYIDTYTLTYSSTGGVVKEDPELSFDVTEFNAVLEEQATTTFPEINDPNGVADFTWSSSDPNVATIDANTGAITMKATGVTLITATFAGDSDYKAGSASYTLKITSNAPKSAGGVTYTVANKKVTCDKTPDPFSAEYSQTHNTSGQMTNGNSATLTLKDFDGYAVESIVLNMRTNKSAGKGTIKVSTDDTEVHSQEWGWESGDGTQWRDVTITPSADWTGSTLKIVIAATVNSLYINSYTINYKPVGAAEREEAGISFDVTEFDALIENNATTTFPALQNPNDVSPVIWSSSNTDIATVDENTGAITLLGIGSTVITASFAGDADFKAGEASYTLNVNTNDVNAVRPITYTVSSTTAVTCSEDPDPFSATYSQTYATKEQLTNGNTATLTLTDFDGQEIDHIVLNMHTNASKGKGTIAVKVGEETYFDGDYTGGNGTDWRDVTLNGTEGLRGSNVTITIAATENSLYIHSFTIYYKPATGASKASAGLTFDEEEFYAALNEEGTIAYPTLNNPNGLTPIVWESGDENIAQVDNNGNITLVKAGTVEISASYAGDDNYLPGKAKYTLQVWDGITYEKITDASKLEAGMTITLYDEELGVALSTTQNTNNRASVKVTDESGNLNVVSPNVQPILLGGEDGAWTLSPEEGKYFYCTGKDNMLRVANKDTATVDITIASDGKATIYFNNKVSGRVYLYCNANSGNPIFSCYNQRVDETPDPASLRALDRTVKAASDYHDVSLYLKDVPIVSGISTPRINLKDENMIFDLNGRRVTGKLTPGIYIRGGKKILIPNGN